MSRLRCNSCTLLADGAMRLVLGVIVGTGSELGVGVGIIVVDDWSGMCQRPVLGSRRPVRMTLGPSRICTWSLVNRASKLLSQNWLIDTRALLCRSGKMWACRAARGRWGISRRAVCVALMMLPFGSFTRMPSVVGRRSVQWLSLLRK